MKLIAKVANILDRLNDLLALMAIGLIAFLMLSVTYAVVARYFLGFSTKGLFEIWEYSLLYIPFLGAAWLLKREGHVSVDVLLNHLKPRVQAIINTITSVLGAMVCLTLVWYGTQVTWRSFQEGSRLYSVLYTPEFLIVMIIPIGSFLLFIQFLRRTYRYSKGGRMIPDKEQRL